MVHENEECDISKKLISYEIVAKRCKVYVMICL